jgi:ATP-dependent Clp protease ATP-binding subunit ClpA
MPKKSFKQFQTALKNLTEDLRKTRDSLILLIDEADEYVEISEEAVEELEHTVEKLSRVV